MKKTKKQKILSFLTVLAAISSTNFISIKAMQSNTASIKDPNIYNSPLSVYDQNFMNNPYNFNDLTNMYNSIKNVMDFINFENYLKNNAYANPYMNGNLSMYPNLNDQKFTNNTNTINMSSNPFMNQSPYNQNQTQLNNPSITQNDTTKNITNEQTTTLKELKEIANFFMPPDKTEKMQYLQKIFDEIQNLNIEDKINKIDNLIKKTDTHIEYTKNKLNELHDLFNKAETIIKNFENATDLEKSYLSVMLSIKEEEKEYLETLKRKNKMYKKIKKDFENTDISFKKLKSLFEMIIKNK